MYDRLLRHDLGNDLQVVTGFAEHVAGEVKGKLREYAERIGRTARRSADLIERVGDLVSTLKRQTEPEPRSLEPVLTEVVAEARDQYESLTVAFDPDEFDYRVYGGDLLDSVFANVITNAAVHNEDEVRVVLSARADADRVTVSVADDGSGIPDALADSLFEMGVKGPDSDGTGYGLGFMKTLAESYGGDIEVRESADGGADFRITLERV